MTVTNLTQTVNQQPETIPQELQPVVKAAQQLKCKMCAVAAIGDPENDLIDSCSISDFQNTKYDIRTRMSTWAISHPGPTQTTVHHEAR